MHIPDNYLSPATCGVMFAVAAPIVGVSVKRVQVRLKEDRELCQGQLKNVQKWQFENVQLWQFKMALYD